MTPKEKANNLFNILFDKLDTPEMGGRYVLINGSAKQCALICVDEELKLIHRISHQLDNDNYIFIIKELEETKQEIEKL